MVITNITVIHMRIGIIVAALLIIAGVGTFVYSNNQASKEAAMHQEVMMKEDAMKKEDAMMKDDAMASSSPDAMMKDDHMSSSSEGMMKDK